MRYNEAQLARVEALYRRHGMVPTSTRVWNNCVDVTAEPPSTWPPPWSWYVGGRHGDDERAHWLKTHDEAVAELGEVSEA